MTHALSVAWIQRTLASGAEERLDFELGVNLLVGRPNTGKTKWLQTLDFLLGDSGEHPFFGDHEEGLAERFAAASAKLIIGSATLVIERRWRELGSKSKVYMDGEPLNTREFQQLLLEKLSIPLLRFPKGNPMSGLTWPELSFRMLLRHMYRRQPFWGDFADLQPESEQHACLLQFLGVAEHIFTDNYGTLVQLKMRVGELKSRRAQYSETLDDLAKDLLSEPGHSISATSTTVAQARTRLDTQTEALQQRRSQVLEEARDKALVGSIRSVVSGLGEKRAEALAAISRLAEQLTGIEKRRSEMGRYREELADEMDRMSRVNDSGEVLADLRVTHCPACDQSVESKRAPSDHCFLCSQELPSDSATTDLGKVRVQFETDRLKGESKETDELIALLRREAAVVSANLKAAKEELLRTEQELSPARKAVSALVQGEVSALDRQLGELTERQRQLVRIEAAVAVGDDLNDQITRLEESIEPLQAKVDSSLRAIDFDAAGTLLEEGMNAYIDAINRQVMVWRHSRIRVHLSQGSFSIKVGNRHWRAALGGTDSLYFLMAYHYGLMTLSNRPHCHYPGFTAIDVPAEFAGEAVEDKENFIVQPFIDLTENSEYEGTQLIITGASFAGLKSRRVTLTHVYVA
jgi:hypothetical protein